LNNSKLLSGLIITLLLSTSITLFNPLPNAYATAATGGTITYTATHTVHTFTTSGTFTVTSAGDVDYLVIGGGQGGGGGSGTAGPGGGGGSGQFKNGTGHAVTVQGYTITVGAGTVGGAGIASGTGTAGGTGGSSIFDTITSTGGSGDNGAQSARGGDGGDNPDNAGGTYSVNDSAGGGGAPNSGAGAAGGSGVGGTGGSAGGSPPTDGTANTGSGGGGGANGPDTASSRDGADGAVGVVIISYITEVPYPDAITDLTYTNLESDSVDLLWTEPNLQTGNLTNYMVNSTTPWSSSTNFLGNTTNTFYNVTGLNWGTDYSFSASALTVRGYNFTGNVLNITTTSPIISGVAPTSLTVNDCYHTCSTQLNLEWLAGTMDNIVGYRIFMETPVGNVFTTIVSNTTTTTLYYNSTGLTAGQFYNYKVASLNSTGLSENSTAYAASTHKLPYWVTDLVMTSNSFLDFIGTWTQPALHGTLVGYQVNYTTPVGDPQTIYTSSNPTTSITIPGLDPATEYSFRVAAVTNHGINASGSNIANATTTSEIAVGDLNFDAGTNPDVEPIWYENYVVDSTTNNVQVRYSSALTVDCTITEKVANNVNTYTGLSETAASGYVYHNFTVTNSGNDILDWDCYDQTDALINGQYSLTQAEGSSGVGGFGNVPLFSLMGNFTGGLYGTEGDFAGIDLITLFIVVISMLGFNRKNPALGVGVMATLLGAAWYFELIPWTSGVLGGIAVVLVLAIGQGTKRD
jgi:hypothetical protein